MITSLLVRFKHRFPALWELVESVNGAFVRLRYRNRLRGLSSGPLSLVEEKDIPPLSRFLNSIPAERREYFDPHPFDEKSLRRLRSSGSLLMLKAVDSHGDIAGYCFLRCFFTGKAFFGLTVGDGHSGRGLGTLMWHTGAGIAGQLGLRLFATISEQNQPSLKSCSRGWVMETVERLPGGYLLIRCISLRDSRL